jgi:hypothetical protein
MAIKTAKLYYYAPHHDCFKRGIESKMKLYNRRTARLWSARAALEPTVKKFVKALGFRWDKANQSYCLENPAPDVIEAAAQFFTLKVMDYREGQESGQRETATPKPPFLS